MKVWTNVHLTFNRLLASLQDTKDIIKECAAYLTMDKREDYEVTDDIPVFDVVRTFI